MPPKKRSDKTIIREGIADFRAKYEPEDAYDLEDTYSTLEGYKKAKKNAQNRIRNKHRSDLAHQLRQPPYNQQIPAKMKVREIEEIKEELDLVVPIEIKRVRDEQYTKFKRTRVYTEPRVLDESTMDTIAEYLDITITAEVERIESRWPAFSSTTTRVFFSTADPIDPQTHSDGTLFPIFFEGVPSLEQITNALKTVVGRNIGNQDYVAWLYSIDINAYADNPAGGCFTYTPKPYQEITRDGRCFIVSTRKSKDENCVFPVFGTAFDVATQGNVIRKKLGMTSKTQVPITDLERIYEMYQELKPTPEIDGFVCYNEDFDVLIEYGSGTIEMLLKDNHYWTLTRATPIQAEVKTWCDLCKRYYVRRPHNCNMKGVRYIQKSQGLKSNFVYTHEQRTKTETSFTKYIHWRVKTETKEGVVTVVESQYLDPLHGVFTNTLENTVRYFTEQKNIIINTFGGSQREFLFLLQELTKLNLTIEKAEEKIAIKDYILLPAGNILTFKFGKNRVQDLRQFVKAETFDKVLQDFRIEEKTEVESLEALTLQFNKCIYETVGLNVSDFLTIGQLGYKAWTMGMSHTFVEIPTEEKCAIIVESRYGARTFPMRLHYQSSLYEQIMSMTKKQRKDTKIYQKLEATGDYRVSVDGVSLYPTVMALNTFGTHESTYYERGGEKYYNENRWGLLQDQVYRQQGITSTNTRQTTEGTQMEFLRRLYRWLESATGYRRRNQVWLSSDIRGGMPDLARLWSHF